MGFPGRLYNKDLSLSGQKPNLWIKNRKSEENFDINLFIVKFSILKHFYDKNINAKIKVVD